MKQIYLENSLEITKEKKYVMLDDEDYEFLKRFKWYYYESSGYYYPTTLIQGYHIRIHNLLIQKPEEYDNHVVIDHIDKDSLNNQKSNLRFITHRQNSINRKLSKRNKTGFHGVYFNKSIRKYTVSISLDGYLSYLGTYNTAIEAAKAYDEESKKYHKEFANLNFPEK